MKNKKAVIFIVVLAVIVLGVGVFLYLRNTDGDTPSGPGGVRTETQSKIYEDTNNATHSVYIDNFEVSEEPTEGDNIYISKDNPVFRFECHGLTKGHKLYVFVDGNIDDVAGEYDIGNDAGIYSNAVSLEDKFLSEGEHVVQFVQFDGNKVLFCKTRHYTVNVFETIE